MTDVAIFAIARKEFWRIVSPVRVGIASALFRIGFRAIPPSSSAVSDS